MPTELAKVALLALAASMLGQPANAQTGHSPTPAVTSGAAQLPDTPAGRLAKLYIAAYNDSSDAASTKFEEAHRIESKLKESGAAERGARMRTMRARTGELTIQKVTPGENETVNVRVMGAKGVAVDLHFVPAKEDTSKLDFVEVATYDIAPQSVTAAQRAAAVEDAAKAMETGYVFPEKGAKMAQTIREKLKAGGYDGEVDDASFAQALAKDLRAVSNDKHIGVNITAPQKASESNGAAVHIVPGSDEMAKENYGFAKVERLEGNIGYIKFNFFADDDDARQTALAALRFVAHCDALIFDLRQNGGGSPEMIRFITSSLFDKTTLLNQMMDREGKVVEEFSTLSDFAGPRFGEKLPVFVLTSSRTFSGAEEFSYNLKALKRATIVGETTGGGAHPVRGEKIGDHFMVRVPYMRAHNPITGTNWEGTGVEPDVKVPAEQALDQALKLAKK